MSKVISAILANEALVTTLILAIGLELDLTNDKRGIGTRFPFVASVVLSIEPSDVYDFVKLLPPLIPRLVEVWNDFRGKTPEGFPLRMLEFVYNLNCRPYCSLFVFHSEASMLQRARSHFSGTSQDQPEKGWIGLIPLQRACSGHTVPNSARLPDIFTIPHRHMNNHHVRADKKNQLQLRTEMTEADKDIIRGVADKTNKNDSVPILRKKMKREDLYADIRNLV